MGDGVGWHPPSCEGQRGLAWRRRTGAMQGVTSQNPSYAQFERRVTGAGRKYGWAPVQHGRPHAAKAGVLGYPRGYDSYRAPVTRCEAAASAAHETHEVGF